MLPVSSEIKPINTAPKPPPIMDITRNDEAIFVSSPKPFIPSAKIVGNMMDMKNGTHITVYTAIAPFALTPTMSKIIFIMAYKLSNLAGFI